MITVQENHRSALRDLAGAKLFVLGWIISLLVHLPAMGSNVVAWGAGTNVAVPPDYNNYG